MRHATTALLLATLLTAAVAGICSGAAKAPSRISAGFVMTRTLKVLRDSIRSEGRLTLGGPGLLRWEMTKPTRSVLVVNNGSAWIHYPDLGITKGFDLSADPVMKVMSEHLLVITGGRLDSMSKLYEVSQGAEQGVMRLVPRQVEVRAVFASLRVSMAGSGVIRWVEMESSGGDLTRIEFNGVAIDPPQDPSLFEKPAS
jgi:outer membrane lipoprotein-sorting protein